MVLRYIIYGHSLSKCDSSLRASAKMLVPLQVFQRSASIENKKSFRPASGPQLMYFSLSVLVGFYTCLVFLSAAAGATIVGDVGG